MVEQKNGAVVRRIAGYRRYVGLEAAATLGRLYGSVRLFVNFFQPSFKLAGKVRDGAKVTKRCHAPATPCQRLMADPRTSDEVRRRAGALHATLDPVRLLSEIRLAQQQLVEVADQPATGEATAPSAPTLAQFLLGLRASWQEGEVRPTAKPKKRVAPCCRHVPDPFEAVSAQVRGWFEAEPWRRRASCLSGCRVSTPARVRKDSCERCNAGSRDGGGRLRVRWCLDRLLLTSRHPSPCKPRCNPSRNAVGPCSTIVD